MSYNIPEIKLETTSRLVEEVTTLQDATTFLPRSENETEAIPSEIGVRPYFQM